MGNAQSSATVAESIHCSEMLYPVYFTTHINAYVHENGAYMQLDSYVKSFDDLDSAIHAVSWYHKSMIRKNGLPGNAIVRYWISENYFLARSGQDQIGTFIS